MSDEHRIRADEDIVPHLRLEKRLLTWRAADEIERLSAERDALRALLGEAREWLFFTCEDDPVDLYARIDAALNKGGGNE